MYIYIYVQCSGWRAGGRCARPAARRDGRCESANPLTPAPWRPRLGLSACWLSLARAALECVKTTEIVASATDFMDRGSRWDATRLLLEVEASAVLGVRHSRRFRWASYPAWQAKCWGPRIWPDHLRLGDVSSAGLEVWTWIVQGLGSGRRRSEVMELPAARTCFAPALPR